MYFSMHILIKNNNVSSSNNILKDPQNSMSLAIASYCPKDIISWIIATMYALPEINKRFSNTAKTHFSNYLHLCLSGPHMLSFYC